MKKFRLVDTKGTTVGKTGLSTLAGTMNEIHDTLGGNLVGLSNLLALPPALNDSLLALQSSHHFQVHYPLFDHCRIPTLQLQSLDWWTHFRRFLS